MPHSDLRDRYGRTPLGVKILWTLVALAMIVLGAVWTFGTSGTTQTFGPIVAGLGVALGYVVLLQKRK
jgi:ABC-type polysaccharide/polyol phosphate export permease